MTSRSGADSVSLAGICASANTTFTAATNTISWTEPKTGKTLTLSGNVSVDFFFQAEDGIRDLTVTGVQTCALPISKLSVRVQMYDYWNAVALNGKGRGTLPDFP